MELEQQPAFQLEILHISTQTYSLTLFKFTAVSILLTGLADGAAGRADPGHQRHFELAGAARGIHEAAGLREGHQQHRRSHAQILQEPPIR
jgi:hypothetical protein